MAIHVANAARVSTPAIIGRGVGDVVCQAFTLTMAAAWATSDLLKLCKLPKGHIPLDLVIDWPAMDTGVALVYDIGLYADSGVDATLGTVEDVDCFFDGSTVARAVGRERMGNAFQAALASVKAPSDSDRIVAALATTGGAGTAASAITGYFLYRAAGYDD